MCLDGTMTSDGGAVVSSSARMLALAQKLHDEYVADGQNTRARLISDGQSTHDQVIGQATAKQQELLAAGQATYDESVSAGKAQHDALIAQAESLVAEAKKKRAEVLAELGLERGVLRKEIEELRALKRSHRAHLRSYLKAQLIELEQTSVDPPS